MAVSGLAPITAGDVRYQHQVISTLAPHAITRLGITHILEGRQLFTDQTVEDNLMLGAYSRLRRDKTTVAAALEREMNRFPILRQRRKQLAGTLSVLLDEPSMGLAPRIVQEIARTIRSLRDEGRTVLLVEQMATVALSLASRAYVLESGRVILSGTGAELARDPEVKRAYLGG
jgi:branched-chain amino acid transport system ATP-binding protein